MAIMVTLLVILGVAAALNIFTAIAGALIVVATFGLGIMGLIWAINRGKWLLVILMILILL